jgi:branched-chain amino acid transport system ATP-binding protein
MTAPVDPTQRLPDLDSDDADGTGALLEVRDVTVRFGGLVANDEVRLEVRSGAIAGLIGPNGAGKTNMFNVITGARPPTLGSVLFDRHDITDASRQTRSRRGMARTFQNLSLVPSLSVLDNVTLGCGRFRRSGLPAAIARTPRLRRQDRLIRDVALGALDFVGLVAQAGRPTGALAMEPRLLLLDEPSAGMGPRETAQLAEVIERARAELGLSVLLVEHDMSFVRALAETCTVLEFGRVLASGPTHDVLADPAVAEAYLGTTGAAA